MLTSSWTRGLMPTWVILVTLWIGEVRGNNHSPTSRPLTQIPQDRKITQRTFQGSRDVLRTQTSSNLISRQLKYMRGDIQRPFRGRGTLTLLNSIHGRRLRVPKDVLFRARGKSMQPRISESLRADPGPKTILRRKS